MKLLVYFLLVLSATYLIEGTFIVNGTFIVASTVQVTGNFEVPTGGFLEILQAGFLNISGCLIMDGTITLTFSTLSAGNVKVTPISASCFQGSLSGPIQLNLPNCITATTITETVQGTLLSFSFVAQNNCGGGIELGVLATCLIVGGTFALILIVAIICYFLLSVNKSSSSSRKGPREISMQSVKVQKGKKKQNDTRKSNTITTDDDDDRS